MVFGSYGYFLLLQSDFTFAKAVEQTIIQFEIIHNCSDCNWTQSQNHLVCKRTINHIAKCVSLAKCVILAKWLSVRLRTKWFWVRVQLQSLNLQISRLL